MNVTWYTSDDNETYHQEIEEVSDAVVVLANLVAVWILLANSGIIVCFIINRKKIWPSFSTQVLCLSVTDLFVGLSALPLTILPLIENKLNYGVCSLIFFIFYSSQCASLYQIFGICVHRCIVINKASRMNEQRSDFRFPLALAFTSWILSVIVNALLHFLYGGHDVEIMQCKFNEIFADKSKKAATFLFIVYFIPFFLTNILYVIICMCLRSIWKKVEPTQVNELEVRSNGNPHTVSQGNDIPSGSENGAGIRAQQKVVRTVGILMFIFNICTIPLIAIFLIQNRYQVSRSYKFIVSAMFILNSAINPFVYALRTNWLKIALKQMFRSCFRAICT